MAHSGGRTVINVCEVRPFTYVSFMYSPLRRPKSPVRSRSQERQEKEKRREAMRQREKEDMLKDEEEYEERMRQRRARERDKAYKQVSPTLKDSPIQLQW